jgi:hypothetical protein
MASQAQEKTTVTARGMHAILLKTGTSGGGGNDSKETEKLSATQVESDSHLLPTV